MHSPKLTSFVLFVSDVTKSKDFYVKVLDQEVAMDIGNVNVGFKSGLAIWERNYATNTIFGSEAARGDDRANLELYFETDDLDGMFGKVAALGVKLVHAITVQPWQQRVFRVYDPDGFVVEIAEAMDVTIKRLSADGLSADAIAGKTFMPIEAVRAMLGGK